MRILCTMIKEFAHPGAVQEISTREGSRWGLQSVADSVRSISIRLPEGMLAELKTLANKKDVPYQSQAKIYLARQISLERGSLHKTSKK